MGQAWKYARGIMIETKLMRKNARAEAKRIRKESSVTARVLEVSLARGGRIP